MIDLRQRADLPELLDEGVPVAEARASLADLRFVNRWLGNRGAFLEALRPFLIASPHPRLLDVGCGSGDLPAFVVRALGRPMLAVGVDLKRLHLQQAPSDMLAVQADVRHLPFRDGTFDVVTVSLFLHHFGERELPVLLRHLYGLARRALVVNDLRRAHVPYLFGRALFPVMFRSRVSVEDGLVSIRRGFTARELEEAFARARIPVRIRRSFPYRLLAVAPRAV
ncbi:MAG TPA: methyltransferase domain-containing protein [Vicinamibacteria bacterium]|nr:methyltransferase domain-containing protein [Vicinamibacteria bacterium]